MRISIGKTLLLSVLALVLGVLPGARAQQTPAKPAPPAQQPSQPQATPATPATPEPAVAKLDPEEEAGYKAFFELKADNYLGIISAGEEFLKKFPETRYRASLYARLTQAYFGAREMDKMYAAGEKALELDPDNIDVLALIAWVLPHTYKPNELDAGQKLAKSERYSKHALELLTKLQKPAEMPDADFAVARDEKLSTAHSALGLTYFRESRFADSLAELQQAIQLTRNPDPADLFVLGLDLERVNRFTDAAEAFGKCAQIPGQLQDRCKQDAEQAKRQAATQPAAPKP